MSWKYSALVTFLLLKIKIRKNIALDKSVTKQDTQLMLSSKLLVIILSKWQPALDLMPMSCSWSLLEGVSLPGTILSANDT